MGYLVRSISHATVEVILGTKYCVFPLTSAISKFFSLLFCIRILLLPSYTPHTPHPITFSKGDQAISDGTNVIVLPREAANRRAIRSYSPYIGEITWFCLISTLDVLHSDPLYLEFQLFFLYLSCLFATAKYKHIRPSHERFFQRPWISYSFLPGYGMNHSGLLLPKTISATCALKCLKFLKLTAHLIYFKVGTTYF